MVCVIEPAPAEAGWYDREDGYVQSAIEMIRVYQFKMPDGIGPYRDPKAPWPNDWWDAFWESLEREVVVEQRKLFIRRWLERNAPGGRQDTLDAKMREWHPYVVLGQTDLANFSEEGSA